MSAPPQTTAPNPYTNFLNVYMQIANKMGFQQQQSHIVILGLILGTRHEQTGRAPLDLPTFTSRLTPLQALTHVSGETACHIRPTLLPRCQQFISELCPEASISVPEHNPGV
jgi:hypothetical protein